MWVGSGERRAGGGSRGGGDRLVGGAVLRGRGLLWWGLGEVSRGRVMRVWGHPCRGWKGVGGWIQGLVRRCWVGLEVDLDVWWCWKIGGGGRDGAVWSDAFDNVCIAAETVEQCVRQT